MATAVTNAQPQTTEVVKKLPDSSPTSDAKPASQQPSNLETQNLFAAPAPPSEALDPLTLPLALPQTVNGFDTPFLRAWNPDLELSGIQQEDWLKFIDGLNIAMATSPPLRIVDLVGMAIGFVPFHWCIFASIGLCTVAETSARILNKTLTDRYLKKANSTYFEPRGLKVRLMRTRAMRKFAETRSIHKRPSKLTVAGRVARRTGKVVVLSVPIVRLVVNGFMDPPPEFDPYGAPDSANRRIENLEGLILPVTTDVPPVEKPSSLYDKTNNLAVKLNQYRVSHSEAKLVRNRQLLAALQGKGSFPSQLPPVPGQTKDEKSWFESYQARKDRHKEEKLEFLYGEPTKFDRDGNPVMSYRTERRAKRLQTKVEIATRLEVIKEEGLLWVVLLNVDEDKEIQDTQLADDLSDEVVDEATWNQIMSEEDEQGADEVFETMEFERTQQGEPSSEDHYRFLF